MQDDKYKLSAPKGGIDLSNIIENIKAESTIYHSGYSPNNIFISNEHLIPKDIKTIIQSKNVIKILFEIST